MRRSSVARTIEHFAEALLVNDIPPWIVLGVKPVADARRLSRVMLVGCGVARQLRTYRRVRRWPLSANERRARCARKPERVTRRMQ